MKSWISLSHRTLTWYAWDAGSIPNYEKTKKSKTNKPDALYTKEAQLYKN